MASEKIQSLTGEQVSLLKKTFRLLDTDHLANSFYRRLFERYPEVQHMFSVDMSEQATKLMSVFELVIYSFHEHAPGEFVLHPDVIVPLSSLGKKHTEKGVQPYHYPIANELLLECLKDEAGYVFPKEAELAWKLALLHLTQAMLSEQKATHAVGGTIRDSFRYIRGLIFKS